MNAAANDVTSSDDHGIAGAYYLCDGMHWPTMECSCGAFFKCSTWEEAGAMFDAHLEEHAALDSAATAAEGHPVAVMDP